MARLKQVLFFLLWAATAACANAAPDEDKLGKAQGYPVGTAENWFFDELVRVGSFTAQAEIPGIFGGKANVLAPNRAPMPLPRLDHEPRIRWTFDQRNNLTVDDYLVDSPGCAVVSRVLIWPNTLLQSLTPCITSGPLRGR